MFMRTEPGILYVIRGRLGTCLDSVALYLFIDLGLYTA